MSDAEFDYKEAIEKLVRVARSEGYRRGLADAAKIAKQHGITWGKVVAKAIRAKMEETK